MLREILKVDAFERQIRILRKIEWLSLTCKILSDLSSVEEIITIRSWLWMSENPRKLF